MQKTSSKSTYVIIAVVLLIGAGVYFYLKGTPDNSAISSIDSIASPGSSNVQMVGNRVLLLLNQINALSIDGKLFESATYKSLVDYTVTIPEQNIGRPNPFAPISGSAPKSQSISLPKTSR